MSGPATAAAAPAGGSSSSASAAAAAAPAAAAASSSSSSAPAPTTASLSSEPQYTPDGFLKIVNEEMPAGSEEVRGYDFNRGVDFRALLASYRTMGFQATNLALAAEEVERMLAWRLSHEALKESEQGPWREPAVRARTRSTVWLSFTSNMISCGQREIIRYLVQHRMVSAIVTSAGAVEEDIMKTLRPHYMGDFELRGRELRLRGINRLGNLLVPNLNYVALEEWFVPLLKRMHEEQGGDGGAPLRRVWSPSQIIERMGAEMTDESSVWYWASRNRIPVFCPGLTDGAIGDMIFFQSWERAGFIVDIAADVRRINLIAMRAKRSGMVILGGGLIKHHTCNANLMRNGADHAIFINTAHEFDGSDSGARADEAVSWGKIRLTARPVKIYADATLVFPLLVAATWAAQHEAAKAAAAPGAAGVTPEAAAAARELLEHGWVEPAEAPDDVHDGKRG